MIPDEHIHDLELELASLDTDPRRRIDALNDLAWALVDTDMKRAYALAEEASKLVDSLAAAEPDRLLGRAYSLRTMGYLNQRLGDYSLGMTQLLGAQELFESLRVDDGLADVLDGMAGIFGQIGDLAELHHASHLQLETAERIGDQRRIANAANNLANVYLEYGDSQRAMDIWQSNLEIAVAIGYERMMVLSLLNMAEASLLVREFQQALHFGREGLRASRATSFGLFEIYALDIIGKAYLGLQQLDDAVASLEEALARSSEIRSEVTRPIVLLNLGRAYSARQEPEKALDALRQSIRAAEAIDARMELLRGNLALSEFLEQQGEYAQALDHYKRYQAVKERVFNEQSDMRVKVLQVKHDTETALKEAENLRIRTTDLEREIAERHKVEAALELARDTLEQQVAERTVELSRTVQLLRREVAERERAEAEIQQMVALLEQRVADRSKELAALYDMTILFTEAQNLTDTLEPALRSICANVDGSAVAVHILSADRSKLLLSAQIDLQGWQNVQEVPLAAGFAAWLDEADAPLMMTDKTKVHTPIPDELLSTGYSTYFVIALRVRREVIGILSIYRVEKRPFGIQNVSLLITMAEQLGIIIQNHRLQEQSRHMARVIERQQLARELHDSVAQRIYSLHLFARAGQDALVDGDRESALLRLQQVETNSLYSLREMRLLLYELRPVALERHNLPAAFEKRFDMVERRLGITAAVEVGSLLGQAVETEGELFYIISEALNNVLKHSGANEVKLQFSESDGRSLIIIQDNGCGFETAQKTSGFGLENMRLRAEKIGAAVSIASTIGQGTTVSITI